MRERIAIVDGLRTPFCKAGGAMKAHSADDLGACVVSELLYRSKIDKNQIDELIFGNVAQPAGAANIARVIALKAGLPLSMPAYTVHRNCASGMEAITTGANKILAGEAEIILAGGCESMSNIPLLFGEKMTNLFANLMKSRTMVAKLQTIASFRPSFLKPVIGLVEGLTDPVCGLNMGMTAEVLSCELKINRQEQDEFALQSHQRAISAIKEGRLAEEILPVPLAPKYKQVQCDDDGPRDGQTIEALAKLKPYFNRKTGSVTVGNACPVTDGAGAVLIMTESKCKELGLTPLGYMRAYAYAGLEGSRMGLGPVYATAKLMEKTGQQLSDFERVELNEAFAAQVLGCLRAFESDDFAKKYLGRDQALGSIDQSILNVNGGAVALGHPVGTTGTRLIITLLKELKRSGKQTGLATLCIGGGQGAALAMEVN